MTFILSRTAYDAVVQATQDVTTDGHVQDYYSGRHMYGQGCLAVVVDGLSELIHWLFSVQQAAEGEDGDVADELSELVQMFQTVRTRHDSLGYQQVYYWPEVEVAR